MSLSTSYIEEDGGGPDGYDFRDQDSVDYSANGTYSSVSIIILYHITLIRYIVLRLGYLIWYTKDIEFILFSFR